jgi:adenylosuccinate lyase
MEAWSKDDQPNELNFRQRIETDPEIAALLPPEKIAAAFDVTRQLTNIDEVFDRVLAEG